VLCCCCCCCFCCCCCASNRKPPRPSRPNGPAAAEAHDVECSQLQSNAVVTQLEVLQKELVHCTSNACCAQTYHICTSLDVLCPTRQRHKSQSHGTAHETALPTAVLQPNSKAMWRRLQPNSKARKNTMSITAGCHCVAHAATSTRASRSCSGDMPILQTGQRALCINMSAPANSSLTCQHQQKVCIPPTACWENPTCCGKCHSCHQK
jgi:hypothetical protein